MADDDSQREVLSSLPRTRPVRRSSKRDGAKPAAADPATSAKNVTSAKKAAAKPKAAAAKPKRKTTASAAKPKAAVAKPKPKPAEPVAPPAGWETDAGAARTPGGTEIVTTAVKAIGELAQIGVAVGGQAVKSVLSRLPRP
jgi:hypothetical protein